MKLEVTTRVGSLRGRKTRSPLPFQSAKPSESCTSGRQSTRYARSFSENQYMLVSGATPNCAMSLRVKSALSTSITTPLLRLTCRKRYAPHRLGPVQQGVYDHRIALALRRLQVEFDEVRKLFRRTGHGRVDRDAARGQPILLERPDRAHVGCAEKCQPIVGRPIAARLALLQTKACEARVFGQFAGDRIRRHVEVLRASTESRAPGPLHAARAS